MSAKATLVLTCAAVSLAVVSSQVSAAPQVTPVHPKVAQYSSSASAAKIDLKLLELQSKGAPAAGAPSFMARASDNAILVEVICDKLDDSVVAAIKATGVTVKDVITAYKRVVIIVADTSVLKTISEIPQVGMIRPIYKPVTSRSGVADSRADRAMYADRVISRLGTGAGQKVGILSDSFSQTTGVRDLDTFPALGLAGTLSGSRPQDSGDLPPVVEILRDDQGQVLNGGQSDEGAAMAELVHDVAPGAAISFHTAFGSEAIFADGIDRLVQAGCSVIVDDVIYFAEPMYQDGIVAQAAARAVRSGVPFFSAAGNFGDVGLRTNYVDIDPRRDDTLLPGQPDKKTGKYEGRDLHDWGNGNAFLPIQIPAGQTITVFMQWNQPAYSTNPNVRSGSKIDLDLYITSQPEVAALESPLAISRNAQGFGNYPLGDPYEMLQVTAPYEGASTVFVVVDHFNGSQKGIPQNKKVPLEFRIVFDTRNIEIQGYGIGGSAAGGPTMWGHSLAQGVVSVAAVPWWESTAFNPALGFTQQTDPELFTSRGGPLSVIFDTNGKMTRRTTRIAYVPTISAVDGNNTTFFGSPDSSSLMAPVVNVNYDGEPDGFRNFFGTSAAAPNAAAVAALMKEKNPSLNPEQITEIMSRTAIDVTGYRASVGYDEVSGIGLINADAAVSASQQ